MFKKNGISIVLVLGILIFVNLVSEQYYFRLDLTEDGRYTLSEATRNILKDLDETVTVRAYFTEDLPPDISKVKSEFEDFLVEYKRLSGDNLVFTFINPNENEASEQEAMKAGVQPVMINVRDKDQVKQQKAFLGAVLQFGEQKEVIPFIQPGTPLEYVLSTSIKKMMAVDKPVVGLIQGEGEPEPGELSEVLAELSVLYSVEPFSVNETQAIPDRYKTLALLRPKDSLSEGQLAQLDGFLQRGGRLFIALNSVEGDLQQSMGNAHTTGVEHWLASRNIEVRPEFVIDANCAMITVQRQQGFFNFATNMNFPFLPVLTNFDDHPVTKGLEALIFPFAGTVNFTGDTNAISYEPLVFASEKSGVLPAPQVFNIDKQWRDADFPASHLPMAAAFSDRTGKENWKMIVVGDGDFPVSGAGNNRQRIQPDNVNLMVNAIDWLSDDTGLIELRTKGIQFRPLDELEDGTRSTLKYLNFLLPILLLIIYGLLRMQMNRSKRLKRMQENYD